MKSNNIYIVEDSGVTRINLVSVLTQHNYEIIGMSSSAEKAWLDMQNLNIDLVILDFNLKGAKKGIWLAEKLNTNFKVPFIFLTAYGSEHLLQKMLDLNPAGYIMKPFNNPTLLSTIHIALSKTKNETRQVPDQDFKFLKTKSGIVKIESQSLLYLQSDKNNVFIFTTTGSFSTRSKLDNIFHELNFKNLHRIHRRFAVNISKIESLDKGYLILDNQTKLPISKSFQTEELIMKLMNT